MTYAAAIQFLYGLQWFGAKFGLGNTRRLAALAGNPQKKLRFIHVAGTNGKGSTCAMLESIYRAAGWRVGLYTSPHLVSFAERIQVNRRLATKKEIIALVKAMRELLQNFPGDARPTFFEVVTVMALQFFAEKKCDLVIWETGLGGRLDATNIVTPLASVITNVQRDHEKWLGNSLAQIAAEKAGIIKPNVPIVTAATEKSSLKIIRQTARKKNSPLIFVIKADAQKPPLAQMKLPLRGDHQRLNAALAIATVRVLRKKIPVSENALLTGLSQTRWPGRWQKIKSKPGQTIWLEGAHNPASVRALRDVLRQEFPHQKPALILGILQDKRWATMCRLLSHESGKFFLVPVADARTTHPAKLAEVMVAANSRAKIFVMNSLRAALRASAREKWIVITGSLYLVGEALEILRPKSRCGERGLNEWSMRPK